MQQIWISLSERFEELGDALVRALPSLVAAVLVVVATWVVARLVRKAVRRTLADRLEREQPSRDGQQRPDLLVQRRPPPPAMAAATFRLCKVAKAKA